MSRTACCNDLINLLSLETLEDNLFRGQSRDLGGKSVFGGQVISQALVAAARTVENRLPHSLHAYFLRPGDMERAIVYEVDRVRDGRSFAARRAQAIQHGRPILSMIASFQAEDEGLEHQTPMPDVPAPEQLRDQFDLRKEWLEQTGKDVPPRYQKAFLRSLPIEFRHVNPWNVLDPDVREPKQFIWFKAAGNLPDEQLIHRAVLAYASDFNLLSTALLPHGKSWFSKEMAVASIDHAMWFHRDVKADDWMLYAMDSPTSQGARGFSLGMIFSRGGELIASVTQENLMRRMSAKAPHHDE